MMKHLCEEEGNILHIVKLRIIPLKLRRLMLCWLLWLTEIVVQIYEDYN